MELLIFALVVAALGALAIKWGSDSTPRIGDGHLRG
jgi:hypothetical protein